MTVTGVNRQPQQQAVLQTPECQPGDQTLTHSLLYMPDSLILLLGPDLFCKFYA